MADITQELHLLNSTVVNFNASLGFNSNPSTLSVTLAEDPDLSEEFGNVGSPASNPNQYVVGGTRWEDGNPGTYVEFETPAPVGNEENQFKFGGFVTDWRRKNDIGGNLVTVNMSDPRIVFDGISIITDIDTRPPPGMQDRNVVDVLGYWGNIVNAGWTRKGVPWQAVYEILNDDDHIHNIYGQNMSFLVNSLTDPANGHWSWFDLVDDNYRLPTQNTTLAGFFNKVAADHNMDYYAKAEKLSGRIFVTLYPIPRHNTDALADTSLHQLVSTWADISGSGNASRLKSIDYGRELRTDPSHTVLWGDNRKSFVINTQSNGILPIYDRFKDGTYSDRVIVDLSNISDTTGLPTLNVEKMKLTGGGTYTKSRTNATIAAYPANENILRAALHSKEAWATAVWYAFKDGSISVGGNNAFDALHGTPLGGSGGAAGGGTSSGTPAALGIVKPPFDRSKGSAGFNAFSSSGSAPTSLTEAKKEAVYRTTKKVAEEYYGRVFITPLPTSAMIDTLISTGLGGAGANSYVSKDKRFLVEYEVASEAWPVADVDDYATSPWFPSEMLGETESDEFQTQEGLIKGTVLFNKDAIKGEYPQADFVNMPTDRYFKSGPYLFTSAASFNQYQFDPRFVIVKVTDHIDLGFSPIRGITLEKDEEGNVISHSLVNGELPRPPKDKDMSGGTQDFLSSLYYDFSVITNLVDGNGNPVPVIESAKKIDAEHYYNLIYHSSLSNKEKLGFGEKRFLGHKNNGTDLSDSINIATPLKWNFIRYGPFEGGPIYGNYEVPTKTTVDNSLNPWSYGSVGTMNAAGLVQAQNMQSASTTLAYANATVEGFPEMALGQAVGNITRLANVSLSYSTAGVITQYRFKTFFGPVGFHKKAEIDKVHRITTDKDSGEDKMSVEEIRREMIKAAKDKETGITLNGLKGAGGGAGVGAGTGSSNTIKSNSPSQTGSQNPQTDILPNDEMNQVFDVDGGTGIWQESYYANVGELYIPYRTGKNASDKRVPDIEGVEEA